jgi:hypothetical protein
MPGSILYPFDNRETCQVETCTAATGGAGICIGELQAAPYQIIRVVYDQTVQVLTALRIRYDPNISALQDHALAFLHLPVYNGTIGQTCTTAFSNSNPQKLIFLASPGLFPE